MEKSRRSVLEIQKAVEAAYESEELRDKFETYLKVVECPKEIPKNLWSTRLLFCREYTEWPKTIGWCNFCKIRKRINKEVRYCFYCSSHQPKFNKRDEEGGCTFIFAVKGKDHPHLNPNPLRWIAGARCRLKTVNGKYCKRHQHHLQWNQLHREQHPEIEEAGFIPSSPPVTDSELEKKFPMKMLYRGLSKDLEGYVRDQASLDANQMFDARQELALARATVTPFLAKFSEIETWFQKEAPGLIDKIRELESKGKNKNETEALLLGQCKATLRTAENNRAAAGKDLQKQLANIVDLTEKASALYLRHVNVVDTNHLRRVVNEVFRGLYETLGEEEGRRVEGNIRQLIVLPENENLVSANVNDMLLQMAKTMPMGTAPPSTTMNGGVGPKLELEQVDNFDDEGNLVQSTKRISASQ